MPDQPSNTKTTEALFKELKRLASVNADLLQSCEELLWADEMASSDGLGGNRWHEIEGRARAAIAKAKGES